MLQTLAVLLPLKQHVSDRALCFSATSVRHLPRLLKIFHLARGVAEQAPVVGTRVVAPEQVAGHLLRHPGVADGHVAHDDVFPQTKPFENVEGSLEHSQFDVGVAKDLQNSTGDVNSPGNVTDGNDDIITN